MGRKQLPLDRRRNDGLRANIRAGSNAAVAYESGIGEMTVHQHLSGYRRTSCLNAAQAGCWLGLAELTAVWRQGFTLSVRCAAQRASATSHQVRV